MNKTSIEWADYVWNPVTGCTKVSEGCRNCYADAIARRFWGERKFTDMQCHPERLDQPMKTKKGGRVFVNSMSDLFHPDVPDSFIADVLHVIGHSFAKQHKFIVLTKRPDRMKQFFVANPGEVIPNLWLGVSVEDQKTADERIPLLLHTPAAVRLVSVEPMLEEVRLDDVRKQDSGYHQTRSINALVQGEQHLFWLDDHPRIDWVICGAESGPRRRPMHRDWAQSLRDQCVEANVPFFLKQMQVDGKMTSMPELDGQVWNQYPEVVHVG